MMRSSLGLMAALLSVPAMAGIDGIWLCSSTADTVGSGMEINSYFAVNANGNTAIMAPLAVGDYYNAAVVVSYAVLSQTMPGRYTGFGSTLQSSAILDVSATLGADGAMTVAFASPPNWGGTNTTLGCRKIW